MDKLIQNKNLIHKISRILAILLAASYLVMGYAVFSSNLIPGKYIGVGSLVLTLVVAAIVFFQFKANVALKKVIVLGVISLLMIIGNVLLASAAFSASHFLHSIQEPPQSVEEYSIVALKARHTQLNAAGQSVAFLNSDTANPEVKAQAATKTNAAARDYDSPTVMTMGLQNNDVQLAVFKTSYLQLLKEANFDLYDQLEVLATFTVKIDGTAAKNNTDVTKPFIVYISGIDTYGAISTVSRSDVNILAVVNPVTHSVLLVNTPRDYYVQLHGTTGVKDKLTHAGIYGVDTSVATMDDLYGININYNVRINFSSLVKVVDTLGGVDVYSEYNFSAGKYSYVAGQNHMNGEQALAFSRDRHSFEGGDRTRGQNQLRVITAIIDKMSSPTTALNYQQVLASMQGAFQTNMGAADITTLFRHQLDDMAKWKVVSTSVDGTGTTATTYSMGSTPLYVMVPDAASLNTAKRSIQLQLQY